MLISNSILSHLAYFCRCLYLHSPLLFRRVNQFQLLPHGTQIIWCSFLKVVFTYVLGLNYLIFLGSLAANSLDRKWFQFHDVWILILVICALHFSLLWQTVSACCRAAKKLFNILLSEWFWIWTLLVNIFLRSGR